MVLEVSLDLRWFFVFLGAIFCGFGVALQVLQVDIAAAGDGAAGPSSAASASRVFARLYSMIFGDFDAALLLNPGGGGGGAGEGPPRSLATLTAVICSL